jgi:hypothetical protein
MGTVERADILERGGCPRCFAFGRHRDGCFQAVADLHGTAHVDRLLMPVGWRLERRSSDGGWFLYVARLGPALSAIVSCEAHGADLWMHMSAAADGRVPTWDELRGVKEWLLGDVEAYMVAPPRARYVNINPDVLHLFSPVEQGRLLLPDFTLGTGSL